MKYNSVLFMCLFVVFCSFSACGQTEEIIIDGDDDVDFEQETESEDDIDADSDSESGDMEQEVFSHQIFKHTFEETLDDVATGKYNQPAFSYKSVKVDPKYKHLLNFSISPMMPPDKNADYTNGPLILFSDDLEVIVFSPINHFFVSLIYFENGEIQYGIEGEVKEIPQGFEHRFIMVEGKGINNTIEYWGDLLLQDRERSRQDRYADIGLSYPGYWTDNGAYYYYKTEEGKNEEETLLAVKEEADALGIPYGYMQLDSWWYFKEAGTFAPQGLIRWEPQPEMFPEGLAAFQKKLGLPLLTHNRWFANDNAYVDDYDFNEESNMSIPLERGVFDKFMEDAVSWGVFTYEQDWLVSQYLGSPYLRNGVDHAENWMNNMHSAVKDHGLTMQICMAGAANLMDAVDRDKVTTIRTSIDYAPGVCKECYWPQFHTVNMLAWALGVWPFKDNFHSSEKCGEAEALISALSGGMVGLGDQLGKVNKDIVFKTCMKNGLLLKPDKPATPLDAMFFSNNRPYTTSTFSEVDNVGKVYYLAAYNISRNHPQRSTDDVLWATLSYDGKDVGEMFNWPDEVTNWQLELSELGAKKEMLVYNWRNNTAEIVERNFELTEIEDLYDFGYYIITPVLANDMALIGETDKFVTLADKRFISVEVLADSLKIELSGVEGEQVSVKAYDTKNEKMLVQSVTIGSDKKAEVVFKRE